MFCTKHYTAHRHKYNVSPVTTGGLKLPQATLVNQPVWRYENER